MNKNYLNLEIDFPHFDFFQWEDIQRKYCMKENIEFKDIYEAFLNDLLMYGVLKIYDKDNNRFIDNFFTYNRLLRHKFINPKQEKLIFKVAYYFYKNHIESWDLYGEIVDSYIYE